MNSFHNTTNESGSTLIASESKAKTQEEIILAFFIRMGVFASYPVHSIQGLCHGISSATPITSIRRAVTNLEKKGKIIKTGNMVIGPYGKMVHTWKLAKHPFIQTSLLEDHGQAQG